MIDTSNEKLITISEAARTVPGTPHVSTVWRWVLRGVRGQKLETVLCGGRRFTSEEALTRFFQRSTAAAAGEALPSRTSKQRQRDKDRAKRELQAAGV